MNEGEILREKVKSHRLTASEIAEKMGISRAQLYNWFDMPKLSQANLDKLSIVGITFDNVNILSSEKRVPYYDIDATAGNVTVFNDEAPEYIKQYITIPAFNDCDMFISISSNSMYPKYCAGELIALKKIADF